MVFEFGDKYNFRNSHPEANYRDSDLGMIPKVYLHPRPEKDDYGAGCVDWAIELIDARSRELIEAHPELRDSFLIERNLNKLARKYVLEDYFISARTARRIIYQALIKIVGFKGLEGIEEDPLLLGNEKLKAKRKGGKKI